MSINQPRQSNNPEVPTLEGHSLPLGRFGVEELWGELNAAAICRVLTGEGAVCHVHGLFSPETCQGIRNNFWGNPGIAKRGDNVPGFHVGGYHYGKTTEQYLDECELKRPYVRALFNNVGNPVEAFRVVLAKVAAELWGALFAQPATVVAWPASAMLNLGALPVSSCWIRMTTWHKSERSSSRTSRSRTCDATCRLRSISTSPCRRWAASGDLEHLSQR